MAVEAVGYIGDRSDEEVKVATLEVAPGLLGLLMNWSFLWRGEGRTCLMFEFESFFQYLWTAGILGPALGFSWRRSMAPAPHLF